MRTDAPKVAGGGARGRVYIAGGQHADGRDWRYRAHLYNETGKVVWSSTARSDPEEVFRELQHEAQRMKPPVTDLQRVNGKPA